MFFVALKFQNFLVGFSFGIAYAVGIKYIIHEYVPMVNIGESILDYNILALMMIKKNGLEELLIRKN